MSRLRSLIYTLVPSACIEMLERWIARRRMRPLFDHFHTNREKRVLLSYISEPFRSGSQSRHTNTVEVVAIADVFHAAGYTVDVVGNRWRGRFDFQKYDVFFGFGHPFEDSFWRGRPEAKRIFYATGTYVDFQNNAELARLMALQRRRGVFLRPRRQQEFGWHTSTSCANAIVYLGNEVTKNTYLIHFQGPMYPIPVSIFCFFPFETFRRDYIEARRHFLWFGSTGLVHKGLDICLEVFSRIPQCTLHICGPREEEFFTLYRRELGKFPNIIYHGFVDVSSPSFKNIAESCAFTIFPSCSEGGGASLLTAMATGLIPLATAEASVNLESGILIEDPIDIDRMIQQVVDAAKMEGKVLVELAEKNACYVTTTHTLEKFKRAFSHAFEEILRS